MNQDDLRRASTEALIERQRLRLAALMDAMRTTRRGRFVLWVTAPLRRGLP